MRWLFLLLLILNLFYYVWSQQQSPLNHIEIAPIEQYQTQDKHIRLVSESAVAEPQSAAGVNSSVDASICMFFGGFEARANAEIFRQRLSGLDVQSEVQEVEAEPVIEYWVYLPPLASSEASLRQLKELQARQIDSYIIADSDLSNGISLGIFPRQESAQSVIGRLIEAGYKPSMRELERAQQSFWVMAKPSEIRLLDEQALSKLAQDFSGLKHEMKACSGPAREREFE